MSLKTTLLIVFLAIVTAGLLYLALYKQNPNSQQIVKVTPTPTIFLSPAAASILSLLDETTPGATPGATRTVAVNIDSGKNKVTAVQVELAYDPNVLTNVTVIPGSFISNPTPLINNVDSANGRISYALGVGLGTSGIQGQGTVALIHFNFVPNPTLQQSSGQTSSGSTTISFLPKSLVTAEGALATVLKKTENLTLQVPHQ